MTESTRAAGPWTIAPYFLVSDVVRSANYYRDTLGFQYDRLWGDPPAFCMVKRRGIIIMLNQLQPPQAIRPNRLADPAGEAWDAYIWVENADALHGELSARGARIVRGLCNQGYECRDFEVEDLNGYRLCFGQPLS